MTCDKIFVEEADLGMCSMFGRTAPPQRGPQKGGPTSQRLSDASTTFSDLWGGAYFQMQKTVSPLSIQITTAILRTVHMYLPNIFVH